MSFFRSISKILFMFFLFTKSSTSFSEIVSIRGLVFSDFRINKIIANNKTTSGYLTIENTNKKSERLVYVESNFSEKTELHNMIVRNDIMKMKHMDDGVIIKANSKLTFKPGSYHIMFIKLLKPLQINNKYEVRFMFQNAGSILLKIPVKGRIITPEEKKAHHHH